MRTNVVLMILLILLQFVDVYATKYFVTNGLAEESNPYANSIIASFGWEWLLGYKLVMCGLLWIGIFLAKKQKFCQNALIAVNLIMFFFTTVPHIYGYCLMRS